MKTTDLLAILFLFGVLLGACTKEGPIGPAGEDGQDGIDGIDGIDGQDGQDGIDGNANVIYSNWFYLTEAARDTTIDGSLMKIKDITVP